MSTVTDCHSHFLPGVDDGSASLEESIAMLQLAAAQRIRHMVATPHFYAHHDSPERFLRRRTEAEKLLREEMQWHMNMPQISLGAEVYYYPGISESEIVPMLTFAGGKYILVEMPGAPWTEAMYRDLEGILAKQGITPIIAHVDRYIRPFKTHRIPERLAELPVLVQANAEFFLNSDTRHMALKMLKGDKIHLLGSDCHNMRSRRPNLGAAVQLIEKKLGREAIAGIHYYEKAVFSESF